MKKNLNVIQIKGVRGLIMAGFIVTCLAAGFIAFPGMVCMHLWNYLANYTGAVPTIGLIQGILLWGIMAATYYTFRKDKVVVCMKSPQGLNEEELKAVFADLKKQSETDPILKAMLKARDTELKKIDEEIVKTDEESDSDEKEIVCSTELNK